METLRQDLRYALRALRRAPGFTIAALLILAAAVGLSAPVLSLVEGGLLRGHPLPNPPEVLGGEATGGFTGWSGNLTTPARIQTERLEALLTTLLVLVLFVLAIACVNVAVLLLSRGTTRRQEMAVRATVGGRPGRLLRQLSTEGAVLGLAGGGFGLLLGLGGIALLRMTWPDGLPLWLGAVPEPRATAASVGIPVAAVLLFTLAPAFVAWRRDLRSALATGTHASATPGEGFFRRSLVVLAVAATALLLTSAGLLFRATAPAAIQGDLGKDPESLVTIVLRFPEARYITPEERIAFYETLLARIEHLKDVQAASIASPGTWFGLGVHDRDNVHCGRCYTAGLYLPVFPEDVRHHVVGPRYFDTLGISLVSGREFTSADRVGAPRVAIVNEAFRASFENADPIGRQVQVGGFGGEWYTIVGVVRDTNPRGIGSPADPVPTIYLSALQHPPEVAALAVRATRDDPLRLVDRIQEAVRSAGPDVSLSRASTLSDELARFLAPLRWFSRIFGWLAILAVVLSAAALYGAMSYAVRRRTREIGIRMALGAPGRQVSGMVVRDGVRLASSGATLGFAGAIGLARLLQQLFFGVKAFDLHVYGGVGLLLALVAVVASWMPARRAARVAPMVALRTE